MLPFPLVSTESNDAWTPMCAEPDKGVSIGLSEETRGNPEPHQLDLKPLAEA